MLSDYSLKPPQPPVTAIIIFFIRQEFISVRAESETEWPITKSAQLQRKLHKQTEVRQEKFMCSQNDYSHNPDGAYQYIRTYNSQHKI